MKIYALRDRLIDYYLNPFAGPGDKEVMASVANMVNAPDMTGIAQAPHHFEIWRLGEVQADGTLVANRELLAGCESFVRPTPGKTEPGYAEGKDRGYTNGKTPTA